MAQARIKPPGYGSASIVDLAGALAGQSTELPAVASERIAQAADSGLTVLLVLDGVGIAQIERHVPNGHLARAKVCQLASVFPSSTAPAITSLLSASPVGHHGNPGWFMYEADSDRVIRTLPMDYRDPAFKSESVDPSVWQWQPWTSTHRTAAYCLQPNAIAESVYSRHGFSASVRVAYASLDDLIGKYAELLERADDKFIYLYVPDFDTTAHAAGWQSDEAAACLRGLDDLFARLAGMTGRAGGKLFMVADHGFTDIDSNKQADIADFKALDGLLRAPLCGEPRAAFCYVKDEHIAAFQATASAALADVCEVVASADLISDGWFGSSVSDGFAQRVGDYTLIAHDGWAICDALPGERRHTMVGMHGGISTDETWVPLCIAG